MDVFLSISEDTMTPMAVGDNPVSLKAPLLKQPVSSGSGPVCLFCYMLLEICCFSLAFSHLQTSYVFHDPGQILEIILQ